MSRRTGDEVHPKQVTTRMDCQSDPWPSLGDKGRLTAGVLKELADADKAGEGAEIHLARTTAGSCLYASVSSFLNADRGRCSVSRQSWQMMWRTFCGKREGRHFRCWDDTNSADLGWKPDLSGHTRDRRRMKPEGSWWRSGSETTVLVSLDRSCDSLPVTKRSKSPEPHAGNNRSILAWDHEILKP